LVERASNSISINWVWIADRISFEQGPNQQKEEQGPNEPEAGSPPKE
jgi:hypothetical protein